MLPFCWQNPIGFLTKSGFSNAEAWEVLVPGWASQPGADLSGFHGILFQGKILHQWFKRTGWYMVIVWLLYGEWWFILGIQIGGFSLGDQSWMISPMLEDQWQNPGGVFCGMTIDGPWWEIQLTTLCLRCYIICMYDYIYIYPLIWVPCLFSGFQKHRSGMCFSGYATSNIRLYGFENGGYIDPLELW